MPIILSIAAAIAIIIAMEITILDVLGSIYNDLRFDD